MTAFRTIIYVMKVDLNLVEGKSEKISAIFTLIWTSLQNLEMEARHM